MSRPKRWVKAAQKALDGIAELEELQDEYGEWKDSLPEGLDQSPVAEKLEEIASLDLSYAREILEEAEVADLPLGFGRD